MRPDALLEQALHYFDRAHDSGFKAKAFGRALDVVRSTPDDELEQRADAGTLTELDGIGETTAALIAAAIHGDADVAYLS